MKEKVITIFFTIIIFGIALLGLIIKDQDISLVERRKLTSISTLKEDFSQNLDKYLTDQLPFRNQLLTLSNIFNRYILKNSEYKKVYLKDDYIFEKLYPLDEKSIYNFINKLNHIKATYLEKSNCFYAIIPDKSYFLDGYKYLTINYDALFNLLDKELEVDGINIRDLVTINDYYKTDIHLKQPSYFKIIDRISPYFGFSSRSINYQENVYDSFYGSSYYKVPFHTKEHLVYLTNEILTQAHVKHLEYNDNYVYKLEALSSSDAYNVFLSGPSGFIELENTMPNNDNELIIFRDSFASSLAPLLLPYYKKITLIDLRYISMDLVSKYVDFTDKDVLFLYSTLIVNNSYILK